ncbi:unnamed protein product [Amoebophrya sp. A25]|nr:unnamed protein product [Amoebophrya sp. A25]|eukprot:GSA25T00015386001.1
MKGTQMSFYTVVFLLADVVRCRALVAPEHIDPICNHDGQREQHCADEKFQWMALLSREYCCGDVVDKQDNDSCYWFGMLLPPRDEQGGEIAPGELGQARISVSVPNLRTGLECQHACLSEPGCKTWSFVHSQSQLADLRFACFLHSNHLEDLPPEQLASAPGTVSGRRCTCKTCETRVPTLQETVFFGRGAPPSPTSSEAGSSDDLAAAGGLLGQEKDEFLTAMARDGFYVLRNAISADLADRVRSKCATVSDDMLSKDPHRLGNRGNRRYSLGSAQKTHHLVHEPEWVELLNTEKIHQLVDLLGDYMVVGGGGDLVLDRTDTHQWLHSDLPREEMYDSARAPALAVNFAVHDIDCEMGSLRIFPGSHRMLFESVKVGEEKRKLLGGVKYVCPLRKGDAVIRDLRAWHAGSANLSKRTRYFPNIEFLSQWFADATREYGDHLSPRQILPRSHWEKLIPSAKKKAGQIIAAEDRELETGMLPDIVLPQPSG